MYGNAPDGAEDVPDVTIGSGNPDKATLDIDDVRNIYLVDKVPRVLRGGLFSTHVSYIRSADRNWHLPSYRDLYFGFRVARTFCPDRSVA